MNLWLVTSIRVGREGALRASSIQNLMTAAALAEAGARVLVWVARWDEGGRELLEERLGIRFPDGVDFLEYLPRGEKGEKKTPFHGWAARIWNLLRARARGPWPDAVIMRSPRAIAQLRRGWPLPGWTRLILEYQYPEWAQLWREWRKRNPRAPLRVCVERLRVWRKYEDEQLSKADGILYAARGHETLLKFGVTPLGISHQTPKGVTPNVEWLPSGCLPPDETFSALDSAPFDFGYVGSLGAENGIETLLEALARLETGRLALFGGGRDSYIIYIKNRIEELGLAGRVELCGWVPFREVRGWLRRCRVGVVPISRRQGPEKRQFASPLKLIEWMGAGAPVIAAAVPSVEQTARNEENALLVPPEDPAALAGAMERLIKDEALRVRLVQNGLATAKKMAFPERARRMMEFIGGL